MRQYGYDDRSMYSLRALLCAGLLAPLLTPAAACRQPDEAPPVASVSLSLGRESRSPDSPLPTAAVPLGAPIDLTYRFEVAPVATIEGDYRVFMHVNRDDGTTIWNDDHDLPVDQQTSRWKPGQIIQYTRTRFVPAFSYLGEATVHVGLYRDNDRLSLAGPDPADRELPARSYKVATLELLPRSENLQVIRLSGWHAGEYAAEDSAIEWQWTQKVATLSLPNPRRDVLFYLELDGRSDLFPDTPQQVTIFAGQTAVTTFAIDRLGLFLKKVPITAAQLGAGEMAELRLDVDRTFIPAKMPGGSRDARELGVRVYHAFVEPR